MREFNESEWQDFIARHPGKGRYVAVLTTGIFCRFGCPARTPKRENVRIVDGPEEAAAAGFRPCLRCNPLGQDPKVLAVVRLARAFEADPAAEWSNEAMAEVAQLSPRALQRQFRDVMGLTPRAFRDGVRLRRFKEGLQAGEGVAGAGYDAGYGSAASIHHAARGLGMTAKDYAQKAKGLTIEAMVVPTALGPMVLAATERGICYLKFDETDDPLAGLRDEFPDAAVIEAQPDSLTANFANQVALFLRAEGARPELPVDLYGTAFQLKVWAALQSIPAGEVRTYGELAKEIGHPGAARAVGSANAKNRVAVLVPCHLVLAGGGKLGGYAGGLERKRKLLALEGV